MTFFCGRWNFWALGLWLGGDVFLSFVVAPGAFQILASRDQAGALVGFGLSWMHWGGVICGVFAADARGAGAVVFGVAAPGGALRGDHDRRRWCRNMR